MQRRNCSGAIAASDIMRIADVHHKPATSFGYLLLNLSLCSKNQNAACLSLLVELWHGISNARRADNIILPGLPDCPKGQDEHDKNTGSANQVNGLAWRHCWSSSMAQA